MKGRSVFINWLFIVAVAVAFPGTSFGEEQGFVISAQFENDFFGGGTDRHFSHGTRIECVSAPIKWIADAADKLPWFNYERSMAGEEEQLEARAVISLGQNIYTPEDIQAVELVKDDRPYAGWLYLGFGLVANQGSRRYDKILLQVGVVGESSYSEKVQREWHQLFNIDVPKGWDHQLKDELGITLYYEQAHRFSIKDMFFGLEYDLVPHFGGSLGNVFTYGALGLTARLGAHLDKDFGPPRIRPSLPGSGYFRPGKGFNWYLFAGTEGRVVFQNIFLDGNTFVHSHSVDKKTFVGDLQVGVATQWNNFRFSYIQIYRSKEFNGQNRGDIFGSLSISYLF